MKLQERQLNKTIASFFLVTECNSTRRKRIMNLLEKKVTHKLFGEGSVVNYNDSSIEINFASENKRFMYPDVFEKHLKLHDSGDAKLLAEMIQLKGKQLKEQELKQEEDRLQHRKKQKLLSEYERMTNNHKLHNESQMVFWCDKEEQESALSEWNVSTGIVKSGNNKGKPNKAVRLHRNSAVLLTARDTGVGEKERRILGMYMVASDFIGKLSDDGNIPAHAKHRIKLTKEESDQLLFWEYYTNNKSPEKVSWNTGKYRYFDNVWMAQILLAIFTLKEDPMEKVQVHQFLHHFCKMNQLSIEELEKPNGVLARQ